MAGQANDQRAQKGQRNGQKARKELDPEGQEPRLKSVSSEKAKQVKGGPVNWPNGPREAGTTSLLLPAVQKVRE